jgi:Pentapeptide repeats (8 copies)/NACHT domain
MSTLELSRNPYDPQTLSAWKLFFATNKELQRLVRALALAKKFRFHTLACEPPWVPEAAFQVLQEQVSALRKRPCRYTVFDPYKNSGAAPLDFSSLVAQVIEPLLRPTPEGAGEDELLFLDASAATKEEEPAWRDVFRKMNELRNHISQAVQRPFTLCLPPWLELLFQLEAPDFWSIRSATVTIPITLQARLLIDIASWGGRHVFGNLPYWSSELLPGFPFLSLDEMYVEPLAKNHESSPPQKILDLLAKRIDDTKKPGPTVISADFGNGKSLTARSFARLLAQEYLKSGGSSEVPFPVFIRCAEDLTDEALDLDALVAKAWFLGVPHSSSERLHLKADTRVVFFLDGLDEVFFGERRLDDFFHKLSQQSNERQRFLIFSRPGALPEKRNREPLSVLTIEALNEAQIEDWLTRWNRVVVTSSVIPALDAGIHPVLILEPRRAITKEDLASNNLLELSKTPILLFMIASTWNELQASRDQTNLALLYERFFWNIARGKHEYDREKNLNVFAAAEHLRVVLVRLGELPESVEPPAAMLWLMSRVAWEAHKKEQRKEHLTRRIVDNILAEELGIDPSKENTASIRMGLILALQADLRAENDQILFGHKSFREFLVGRYWAHQLRRVIKANYSNRKKEEKKLLGGDLVVYDNKSFSFLMQIVNVETTTMSLSVIPAQAGIHSTLGTVFHWTEVERTRLREWAQECFEDETQVFSTPDSNYLRDELRAMLRKDALAIACEINNSERFEIKDGAKLLSVLAFYFARGKEGTIHAPDSKMIRLNLSQANLSQANLCRADLRGTNLSYANLFETDLKGANLHKADLDRAELLGANLSEANLSEANLSEVDFFEVNLSKANLSKAKLRGVSFFKANLSGTDLSGTNLKGLDLRDINLHDTNLFGADLHNATYNKLTTWPKGFDPVKAGAKLV